MSLKMLQTTPGRFLILLGAVSLFFTEGMGLQVPSYASSPAALFPSVCIYSLQGSKNIFIPIGLERDRTFVAVGFDPKQQALLEQGLQQFQAVQKGKPQWGLMEIAVIDAKYKPFRASIEPFMRKAVKAAAFMPNVYSLYTNAKQLKLKLGLTDAQDVTFLLLDKQGHILWKNSRLPGNGFLSDFPMNSP